MSHHHSIYNLNPTQSKLKKKKKESLPVHIVSLLFGTLLELQDKNNNNKNQKYTSRSIYCSSFDGRSHYLPESKQELYSHASI